MMTTTDRQAQALITLLETFQPRMALYPYLKQIQNIVIDLETTTTATSTSTSISSSLGSSSSSSYPEDKKFEDCITTLDYDDYDDDGIRVTATYCHPRQYIDESQSIKSHTRPSMMGATKTKEEKRNNNEYVNDVNNNNDLTTLTNTKNQLVNGCSQLLSNIISSPSSKKYKSTLDPSSIQVALKERTIITKILEFDGSLALYYKNYDLIEGYRNPLRRRRSKNMLKRRPGTSQLAFVDKTFYALITGPEGLRAWSKGAKKDIITQQRYAKEVLENYPKYSTSLAKVFAVVICNDAIEFEYLLSKHIISIQQGTSINNDGGNDVFGMALSEYVKGDNSTGESGNGSGGDRTMGIPAGHPFLQFCRCWNAKECDYTTLLAELAYNAVVSGALDVLRFLSSRHNTLYGTAFGPMGDQNLLGEIVAYSCRQPCCLEEIAEGIRTLMSSQLVVDQEDLHTTQRGSLGNSLHLAAAKGDRELVNALLDIGYDPSFDQRALLYDLRDKERDKGYNDDICDNDGDDHDKLWLPEDWARVRGHTRVARLLEKKRKQLQLQSQHHKIATAVENSKTQIRSDNDDESGSSCSGDYTSDSNYDSDSVYDSYDSVDGVSDFNSDYDTEDSNQYKRLSRRR